MESRKQMRPQNLKIWKSVHSKQKFLGDVFILFVETLCRGSFHRSDRQTLILLVLTEV